MSRRHPIIAVTGSSGSGKSTVRVALEHIFKRETINPVYIEGDSFHRYTRTEMPNMAERAQKAGATLSHFGPEGNCFDKLEALFASYARNGGGLSRRYNHGDAAELGSGEGRGGKPGENDNPAGEFTPWEPLAENTDLLCYEGLHGMYHDKKINIAQHVDLGLGVVPIINLEWIQKIHRDNTERGYSCEDTIATILRRMPDYIKHIVPQFSRTEINFQRVPTVDTSNPFIARDIPTLGESFVIIRFRSPERLGIDFPYLLNMLQGSFMSRRNTIVVPGSHMGLAMEIILTPVIQELVQGKRKQAG